MWGIHRGPVDSPHKWPVTRKMFPFDDVIMARRQLATLNLDSNHPNIRQNTNLSMKWRFSNFTRNRIFGIDYAMSNATDLRNMWIFVFSKGVQMNLVSDHLDNAGFNAKSSLLKSIYIINQKKTPLRPFIIAAMILHSLCDYFASFLYFDDCT